MQLCLKHPCIRSVCWLMLVSSYQPAMLAGCIHGRPSIEVQSAFTRGERESFPPAQVGSPYLSSVSALPSFTNTPSGLGPDDSPWSERHCFCIDCQPVAHSILKASKLSCISSDNVGFQVSYSSCVFWKVNGKNTPFTVQ